VVPGPEVTHEIRAHWIAGCPVPAGATAQIDLTALGDFDPSLDAFETFDDSASARHVPVASPVSTEAVALDASDGPSEWSGLGTRDQNGDIDVALWPKDAACAMPTGDYPGAGSGQAMGVTRDGRTLLVVGGDAGTSTITAGGVALDLGTGVVSDVSMRTHRAGATVTPFGSGLLVAGGSNPEGQEPIAIGSAEVFDAGTRRFEPSRLDLEQPRSHHGAVELPSGETLLVGGEGANHQLVRTLEAISPVSRNYRLSPLTDLSLGRKDPSVLRLSDGSILVAGGTDESGAPVDELEWLSEDASTTNRVLAFTELHSPPTVRRAFAAMPGGSVLVAGGCLDAEPSVSCALPSQEVLWITRDGVATQARSAGGVVAPAPLDVGARNPVLVAGSEGRPWLFDPGATSVRRFDPFLGEFVPEASPTPGTKASHFVTADAGLFLWLDAGESPSPPEAPVPPVLTGFRHGTRSVFSPLLGSTGLALDRASGDAYDALTGAVTLSETGATLVVTDTTYAEVHLTIAFAGGPPPIVHLGARSYGTGACPWPKDSTPPSFTAKVDRMADVVTLSLGKAAHACPGPSGRVSVQVEAASPVEIRSITVSRNGTLGP
jgi:hypothetical protein